MSGAFVGFAGSRALPAWFAPAVCSVVDDVLSSGRGVAVGCAAGADELVRSCWLGSWQARPALPPCLVFARRLYPASTFVGSLARRSAALVRFVADSGPGAEFVGFPSAPCPAGLVPAPQPSACFAGFGAGTWSALALAAGLGLSVCVVRYAEASPIPLPAWPGGAWESSVWGSVWVPGGLAARGLWD